jgi:3-deoxy-D-manno-octulosonic-acid transferase
MRAIVWILYQLVYAALLVVAGPFLLLRRGRHYLESLPRRLGLGRSPALERPLWIHAVSVGEVGVAATLATRLSGTPLLVTTITPTGQARALAAFEPDGRVDYLPFDLGWPVRRFLGHHRPRALVLAEGDYWPLLLRAVKRRGLPIAVINARVGDRSYGRMLRLAGWLSPLFGSIDRFGVQTGEDRGRLVALGVPEDRITVTGNLKFETPEPAPEPQLERALLALAGERPILLAGSTMEGEEPMVLDAFAAAGGARRAMLLLAPRHPERFDAVAELARSRETTLLRRSELAGPRDPVAPAVLLLDSIGELAALYRLAAAAFIGGTLVPTGGHNPLEAARFGVALAVGPSMHNFRAMAEQFDRARAWRRVSTPAELGRVWRRWLDDPREAARVGSAASDLVAANRGALDRTMEMLAPMLGAG